jgi:peroxiredoxin
VAQLRHATRAAEVETLNAHVVVISFGTTLGAQTWLQETGAPFTLLLDPDRTAYRAFGLERSLVRSWGPGVWLQYARLLLAGRRWRGIQGDSGQLGGDFLVDANGIIRLAYRSHDPTDRPSVSQLLAVLANCSTTNRRAETG